MTKHNLDNRGGCACETNLRKTNEHKHLN